MNHEFSIKQQAIKIGISSGTISIVAMGLTGLITLDSVSKYSGNLLTTFLTFFYLICGVIFCFKRLITLTKADIPSLGTLTLTGISFSLTVATFGALVHYIKAGYLDPQYAQNALKSSQAKWLANSYSKEAIAGQIELTETFQDPAKWAVVSGFSMMAISLIIFFVVSWFNHLRIATAPIIKVVD